MAKPASSGPQKPLMEKPSANQLKFTARSAGLPSWPITLFSATW